MNNPLKDQAVSLLTAELAKKGLTVDEPTFNRAWMRFCKLGFRLDGSPRAYIAQLGSRLPVVLVDFYSSSQEK